MKMTNKNRMYYVNSNTNKITTNKDIKNKWVKNGNDVYFYQWSEYFQRFYHCATEEGNKKV